MREVKKKFQKSGGDRTFWLKIRVRVGMTIVLLALFILFVPIGLQANRILSNSFGGKAIPKSFSLEEAIRFIGNYSSAANNQRTPMREFPDQQSFPTPNQKKTDQGVNSDQSRLSKMDCPRPLCEQHQSETSLAANPTSIQCTGVVHGHRFYKSSNFQPLYATEWSLGPKKTRDCALCVHGRRMARIRSNKEFQGLH